MKSLFKFLNILTNEEIIFLMENSILIIHNFIFHLPGRVEQKKRKKKKKSTISR